MKRIPLLLGMILIAQWTLLEAQSGCPGCEISLPEGLPEDTIFLSDAPTGQVGALYEGTISFRLPKTTDPVSEVDPNTAPGITLDKITIKSISNLPPGLSWEASQLEFDVKEETDGCMKICGTPLQPGLYLVEVVIEARIFIVDQTTFFSFPIEILPAERNTEGFSVSNVSGCGAVTADFVNNIPSGDAPGFSYLWDFGNGNSSTEESPGPEVYSEPGLYPVRYQAIVDTAAPVLTKALLKEVDCTDILGRPDLRLKVFDSEGEEVFSSVVFENAEVPLSIEINVPIDTGTYRLQVIDEDRGIGGDANCGEVDFDQTSTGSLTAKDFEVELTLFQVIDTIVASDTIRVFEQPSVPELSIDGTVAPLCEADTIGLSATVGPGQWYRGGLPIAVNTSLITITDDGDYWMLYTDAAGCQATSDTFSFAFIENPPAPVFVIEDNLLSVFEEEKLPAEYTLEWRYEDEVVPGVTDPSYCAPETGRYELEVTDISTGCSSVYSRSVMVDPAISNCNITSISNGLTGIGDLAVYPNPGPGLFNLSIDFSRPQEVRLTVLDLYGRPLSESTIESRGSKVIREVDLHDYPTGIYLLRLEVEGMLEIKRLMKR